jgi:Flp pilus assembly pilin Flp
MVGAGCAHVPVGAERGWWRYRRSPLRAHGQAVRRFARRVRNADGASFLEYAFLVALIAMVVIAAAFLFGTALSGDFSEVGVTMQAS